MDKTTVAAGWSDHRSSIERWGGHWMESQSVVAANHINRGDLGDFGWRGIGWFKFREEGMGLQGGFI